MVYPRDQETVATLLEILATLERLERETAKLWRAVTEYVEELRKANRNRR